MTLAPQASSPAQLDPSSDGSVAGFAGERSLARNASFLFVGQAVGLVVPLLTIPYLARVLGPTGWGPIMAAQGLGGWLLLILEYGFELSGTRAVARARATPAIMGDVIHGVQSAKAALALAIALVALVAFIAIPALRPHASLIGWAVAFAMLRGFSPMWFFQGMERMEGAVLVDTITRALASLGVFVLVRGPDDGWRVLALQAVFAGVALLILTTWLIRHAPLRVPTTGAAFQTLREGTSLFACRAWSGLYIQGNTLILSGLAGPAIVAFFGGAERIVRAAINLLQPLTQAFLPRVSFLQASDPAAAQRTVRRALLGVGLFGVLMGACAFVSAPLLVHVLLGPAFDAAIPVVRIMSALPALVAVNTVLGLYWALPLGHDRRFLASIIAAGITNVALAFVLVPRWGAAGMATSAIAAEVVVLVWLGVAYAKAGA